MRGREIDTSSEGPEKVDADAMFRLVDQKNQDPPDLDGWKAGLRGVTVVSGTHRIIFCQENATQQSDVPCQRPSSTASIAKRLKTP